MTKAEELASQAAYAWQSDKDGNLTLEMFPDVFRRGFLKGYEQAEKDLGWISVKNGLPEVGHFVLTCLSGTGTPQCVGMALLLEDGTWWDGDMKVRVDYWMEVPKLKEDK